MDLSILLMGASLHWGQPREVDKYNGLNPGIGLMVEGSDDVRPYAATGIYRNSIERESKFLSAGVRFSCVSLGLMYVTGYKNMPLPVMPSIAAYVEITDQFDLVAQYVGDGIGFLVKWKL